MKNGCWSPGFPHIFLVSVDIICQCPELSFFEEILPKEASNLEWDRISSLGIPTVGHFPAALHLMSGLHEGVNKKEIKADVGLGGFCPYVVCPFFHVPRINLIRRYQKIGGDSENFDKTNSVMSGHWHPDRSGMSKSRQVRTKWETLCRWNQEHTDLTGLGNLSETIFCWWKMGVPPIAAKLLCPNFHLHLPRHSWTDWAIYQTVVNKRKSLGPTA